MADSKSRYSDAAKVYGKITRHGSMLEAIRYYKSKLREAKHNEMWKKHLVNLNEIVDKFTHGVKGKAQGVKFVFKNENYIIKADMPGGYLRVFDKKAKMYTDIMGKPSRNQDETHFKIKKRKEM
ncbi:MAG: hypothetical protein J5749_05715 [Lachnospiraceae bacterium]|nr:hypothetical protein [Lachnospiraceae bacterium]